MTRSWFRSFVVSAVVLAPTATACSDDPTSPPEPQGDAVGLVLSSRDRALTVFSVEAPGEASTIGLAADGSPVTIAARGAIVAVPLGTVPAVAVVDLEAGEVAHTVSLPEGSGATGVAFLNDSIAVVANPGRNSVSPVNVRSAQVGDEIAVGTYPQAVTAANDTVFVLNANLGADFSPLGPATVSVVTGSPPQVVTTIELTGFNANAAEATAAGQLLVVNAGSVGNGDGTLSIVDRAALTEAQHVEGFGDFPGSIATSPDGLVYIASFSYGLAVWDPGSNTFVHSPAEAIEPDGIPSVSGIAFDDDGRLHSLVPECREPSRALRLDLDNAVEREIPTGICPFAITFTTVP